jgi:ZIP family zinc transporter
VLGSDGGGEVAGGVAAGAVTFFAGDLLIARSGGTSRRRIMSVWVLVALVSGVAALAGYALLDGASPGETAFVLAYLGGAILTMLADTMMPEAFENAGRAVGLMTTLGFGLAFALTLLG